MFDENTTLLSPHQGNSSNSQLTCFICIQPVVEFDDEENSDSVWFSLCGILNNLKIKPATATATLSDGEDEEDGGFTDLVLLCDKCSKVVRKLSGLCLDLEAVKLKITYYLNQLDQLIVLEENGQSNRLINPQNDSDLLKRKLKEKCSNIMEKGPSLRVDLSKLDTDNEPETEMEIEDDLSIPPSSSSHQIFKWDINYGYDDDYSEPEGEHGHEHELATSSDDQYDGSESEEELGPELQREYVIIKNLTSQEPEPCDPSGNSSSAKSKRKRNPKSNSCSECDISYASKVKLDEHSMIFHPERYFPPPKNSATTPATDKLVNSPKVHKMYLTHLLNTEVEYCENTKLNGFKCIYCGKLFQNLNKRISILTHLIKGHPDILKRELIQLKKDKKEDEITAIVKMPVYHVPKPSHGSLDKNCKLKHFRPDIHKMMKEYNCVNCGVRTTAPRIHQLVYHPEKLLLKFKKSEEMNNELFKMYCKYLIYKLNDKFKEVRISSKKIKVRCPFCPKLYAHGGACRNHVILAHVDYLSEELVKLQEIVEPKELRQLIKENGIEIEVPVEKCKVCDVLLTKATILKHAKRAHPKEYLKDFVHYDCVNCGEPYGSVMGLRDHSCRNGRFKEVTIGQKISKPGRKRRVGGEHICGICKRRFEKPWGLNYHYSLSHVDKVFEGGEGKGEKWKKLCDEMMEGEMERLEQVCGDNYKVKFRCGYCEERFNTRKLVWVHLVMKHKEIMEGKVKKRRREVKGGGGGGGGGEISRRAKKESVTWHLGEEMETSGGGGGIIIEEDGDDVKEEDYLNGDSVYSY